MPIDLRFDPNETALFVDLYELTMAASYFQIGYNGPACFGLSARRIRRDARRNDFLRGRAGARSACPADRSANPRDPDYEPDWRREPDREQGGALRDGGARAAADRFRNAAERRTRRG